MCLLLLQIAFAIMTYRSTLNANGNAKQNKHFLASQTINFSGLNYDSNIRHYSACNLMETKLNLKAMIS